MSIEEFANTSFSNTSTSVESKDSLVFILPFFAGISTLLASCISGHHIYCHLKHFTCPKQQKPILRIIILVPLYAIYSFSSACISVSDTKFKVVYIDPIHGIAEAVAIYSFLALCYEYLGSESNIIFLLNGSVIKSSIFYCTCCFGDIPCNIIFLRFCKSATLQYVFLKPLTSILAIVLSLSGKYTEGNFRLDSGYLYLVILDNVIVTLALYALLLFFLATRDHLHSYSPVLKFFTIKAVIFLSYWQHLIFTVLRWAGVLTTYRSLSVEQFSNSCLHLLVCVELVVTAVVLRYAFPYSIYSISVPPRLVLDMSGDDLYPPQYGDDVTSVHANKQKQLQSNGLGKQKSPMVQALQNDLIMGTKPTGFEKAQEPLPWEILESQSSANFQSFDDTDTSQMHPIPISSIATRIKAAIDPRDIFIDAMYNVHPNYRDYIQTSSTDHA